MSEIERLEDLSAAQQEALQTIDKTGMCGFRVWCTLFDMGLVDTNGEYDSLTQEGQALVSDYQQRQSEPRTSANQNKPTYEQLEAENVRLRALLEEIERNAPKVSPLLHDPDNDWLAHCFWDTGETIREALKK